MEPSDATTFSLYGITAFDVQYWNGSAWVTVPNGSVTNNNKIVNRFTFDPIVTTSIRVQVNAALASFSRIVEIEAYAGATAGSAGSINVARPANGGTVSASSTYNNGYAPSGATDGERAGYQWASGGGWNDATGDSYPDQLQVNFSGTKLIAEIDVFTVQDEYWNPQPPTETMTFTQYGIVDFDVQYWNGSTWVTIPNGTINGNNKIWRKFCVLADLHDGDSNQRSQCARRLQPNYRNRGLDPPVMLHCEKGRQARYIAGSYQRKLFFENVVYPNGFGTLDFSTPQHHREIGRMNSHKISE